MVRNNFRPVPEHARMDVYPGVLAWETFWKAMLLHLGGIQRRAKKPRQRRVIGEELGIILGCHQVYP